MEGTCACAETFPGMPGSRRCCRAMATDAPLPRVSFIVDDEHAIKVASILEAMGFEAVRSLESSNALHWGIVRLVRKYRISASEQAVLELMLVEQLTDKRIGKRIKAQIARVGFLKTNVFVKTGTRDREQLLRLALQLPVPASESSTAEPTCG
jgi:DNA-binding CsgD family transcriptional regulator